MTKTSPRSRKLAPPPLTVALALNPGSLNAALVSERGRVVAQASAPLAASTTRATVAALVKLIVELAHTDARGAAEINGIGISLPGLLDPHSGRVTLPSWKGWTRVPLGELLERELDDAGYELRQPLASTEARAEMRQSGHPPVTFSSRAVALAAAESWIGAARGKQHVVYISLGDTIESGILVNGHAFLGADGLAGALGWLAVGESFKQDYAAQGCLNGEGAAGALARRALEEVDGASMLGSVIRETPEQLTPDVIVRAARGGDQHAQNAVAAQCRWLGRGLANVISLLNPEAVVLGGALGAALTPFLDEVRAEARLWAAPAAARNCRILAAAITKHAELIGAARLAQG